ncbi:hypothetical protein BABINDRAFT_167115 [Babjeviella inositovora NRRL Y-12698]|uniref:SEC7 domain-containing protein n=1 Tax=Babjeviella inositovora NRRL Y-12698 TaxID=984486 RepID=A0A1E3QQQ2_9ASCO|nr:uncharacterized protein BABINDRAFT_167115 [Babjeviella inositovora NRRL Y-12698]ODQ80015.1 hypothetical protein BABINDRAFT_167115 [Babjeviella inositovora NRRL Y-12698]
METTDSPDSAMEDISLGSPSRSDSGVDPVHIDHPRKLTSGEIAVEGSTDTKNNTKEESIANGVIAHTLKDKDANGNDATAAADDPTNKAQINGTSLPVPVSDSNSVPEPKANVLPALTPTTSVVESAIESKLSPSDSHLQESPSSQETDVPSISVTAPALTSVPVPSFTPNSTSVYILTTFGNIAKLVNKKNVTLHSSLKKALEKLKTGQLPEGAAMFETLRLTLKVGNVDAKILALDCLSKLFSFSLFGDTVDVPPAGAITLTSPEDPNSIVTPPPRVRLVDAAIQSITDSFQVETFDAKMELQVIRALMSAVLNEKIPAHGSSLLTAVRQLYNIFLLSLSTSNQGIAQASLTQVIASVYDRVRTSRADRSAIVSAENLPATDISEKEESAKLTLDTLATVPDDERVADGEGSEDELFVKDAFLLFRTLCKLSVKDIVDGEDMRSQAVRSKLLALHVVHSILKEHIDLFLADIELVSASGRDSTRFIDSIKQYLCLVLSKNAALAVSPVYEICLEIFWLLVSNLRSEFKNAIPVFLDEIYFPVAETKTSSPHQKRYLLSVMQRICYDPRVLIEFYLNYDCDTSMPNICERLIDYLTRLSLTRVEATLSQKQAYWDTADRSIAFYNLSQVPSQAIASVGSKHAHIDAPLPFPTDFSLKMVSIKCIVGVLQSLHSWAQKGISVDALKDRKRASTVGSHSVTPSLLESTSFIGDPLMAAMEKDDPSQFASLKQRKTMLLEGIKLFNYKPKRGLDKLISDGFTTDAPEEIAKFILATDGLDKAQLGEFLGEGDEEHIAIMHAFVNQMDFNQLRFVDAMRVFLQSFRLPGESQKIDRFMLKFAERYVLGNPTIFANADTAYILAYSVVMLNTDQHSAQVKNRMTPEEFIKNNRGIDDGKDLPREFLEEVYTEIQNNEIKLHSEQHAAMIAGSTAPTAQGFFARDTSREAYMQISKELSSKTTELFRTLGRQRTKEPSRSVFYAASHVSHVKSIFDTLWMSLLAGLTPPFKEYDDEDTTRRCLEGIKLAIKIAGMFELDYARTSFIGALVQFANLSNIEEMQPKNVEAIYVLLDIAATEGDQLKTSWELVLRSISQLERLQLIARGVDSDSIPDVSMAKLANRESIDSTRTQSSFFGSSFFGSSSTQSQQASQKHFNQNMSAQVMNLLAATQLGVDVDRIFEQSSYLSGSGIIEFVKALTAVSSEEVESSGNSSHPRMFSLQKMVDVCYYNMDRIRLEWTGLWAIMGDKFNKFGCHSNPVIVFFALDSLRQLSMRFMEIEELAHFKFQKEFLKPFEHIMINNPSVEIQEMVLECLGNMILAKSDKIRSGWKAMLVVLTTGANSSHAKIVFKTDKILTRIYDQSFDCIYDQGAFSDMIGVYVTLAMNRGFPKVGLHALNVLKKMIIQVADKKFEDEPTDEEEVSMLITETDSENKLWFPILSGLHEVIMKGVDLEIRSRALNYMFDALVDYGKHFEPSFWDSVCRQLLFPLFGVLSKHWDINQFGSDDELSVWLSTTLIQALRNMVALFTHYFEALSRMLDGFLELLISCVCQENDTIARIGRSCLQLLVVENMSRFSPAHWNQITEGYVRLFDLTTAKELFKADPLNSTYITTGADGVDIVHDIANLNLDDDSVLLEVRTQIQLQKAKDKSAIVVKCVLQLLMIESLSELLLNDEFYGVIPFLCMVQLTGLLETSFRFARDFNDDYNLRVRLFNSGVIDRLPNLLKQESSSAAVFIGIQFRLYCDTAKVEPVHRKQLIDALVPMCNDLIDRFVTFDEQSQLKNIVTWRPVVVEILQGYYELEEEDFVEFCPVIHDLALRIFDRNIQADLRLAMKGFFSRVGDLYLDRK